MPASEGSTPFAESERAGGSERAQDLNMSAGAGGTRNAAGSDVLRVLGWRALLAAGINDFGERVFAAICWQHLLVPMYLIAPPHRPILLITPPALCAFCALGVRVSVQGSKEACLHGQMSLLLPLIKLLLLQLLLLLQAASPQSPRTT